jgi:hypothetical protein
VDDFVQIKVAADVVVVVEYEAVLSLGLVDAVELLMKVKKKLT